MTTCSAISLSTEAKSKAGCVGREQISEQTTDRDQLSLANKGNPGSLKRNGESMMLADDESLNLNRISMFGETRSCCGRATTPRWPGNPNRLSAGRVLEAYTDS